MNEPVEPVESTQPDILEYFNKILKLGEGVKITVLHRTEGGVKLRLEGETEIPWGCIKTKYRKHFEKSIAMQGVN
ncbi:hypothetical protein KBA63_04170 [Candidatus Woesebacteria bacterium]|nr:hypothetical protein [Candidatus Woesebacteria bacterium]